MDHRDEALLDLKHLNEVLAIQASLQYKYGDAFVQEKKNLLNMLTQLIGGLSTNQTPNLLIDHREYSFPIIRKHKPDSRVLLSQCS